MEKKSEIDMGDLDKFKRRLIRSVAWMLIHQKMPESAVWLEMKKVMGCDCLQLWEHMRSLTQKKLKRLLAAEDRTASISEIARMTITDWQLYDQILVHEDIDVIGLYNMSPHKPDSKVLIDLFALVQRFDIEMKVGDELADAWAAATVHYNAQGHQCSPMLLQKRWYQLKTETRRRFYEFWHSYRGSERQIPKAEQYRPTILQRTLAKRFPEVITETFPDWETSIADGLVILPDVFERRRHIKVLPKPSDDTPDIVVLEPDVETIDLLHESDSEQENNQKDCTDTTETSYEKGDLLTRAKIKVEPEDPVIDVTVIQKPKKTDIAMAQVVEEESLFDNMSDDFVEMAAEEHNLMTIANNFGNKLREAESAMSEQEKTDNNEQFIPKITNVFGNAPMTDETLSIIDNLTKKNVDFTNTPEKNALDNKNIEPNSEKEATTAGPVCLRVDIIDSSEESDVDIDTGLTEKQSQQVPSIKDNFLNESSLSVDVPQVTTNTAPFTPDATEIAVLSKIANENNGTNKTDGADLQKLKLVNLNLSSFGDIPDDLSFADDGIEFIDDGVADIDNAVVKEENEENQVQETKYTDGISTKTNLDSSQSSGFELDEKLFLDPVVYTQKLDDMRILKNKDIIEINVRVLLNKIIEESKPISDRSVDAQKKRIERQRISLSNYMLQKPKNRKYNPIQLCKNPDFNTRLKRLTAGFLSSWQNRTLLKACKPLTIDLTKTFESQLINNTVYLKKSDNNSVVEIDKDVQETASVMPSIIPVQTLIDNTRLDDVLKLTNAYSFDSSNSEVEETLVERNKIIHLPDITQVRRINQSLLTAEVSPIQIQNTINVSKTIVDTKTVTVQTGNIREKIINTNVESTNLLKNVNPDVSTNNDNLNAKKSPEVAMGSIDITDTLGRKSLVDLLKAKARMPTFNRTIQINRSEQSDVTNRAQLTTENQNTNKSQKNKTVWRPTTFKNCQASWTERSKYPEVKHDAFLLTSDTLNKLLHLFNGHSKEPAKKKNQSKATEKKSIPKETEQKKRGPKKSKEVKEGKKWPSRLVTKVVYKSVSCCWARDQIIYIKLQDLKKRKTKHTCEYNNCACCCREELAKLITESKEICEYQDTNERSWVYQPYVPEKAATETVVTDNTPLQATSLQDTNVPTIASVYSLNPESDTEVRFDASNPIVPINEPVEDVEQPVTTSNNTVKSAASNFDLHIPIMDVHDKAIKTRLIPASIETPAKKMIESNTPPVYDVTRSKISKTNPGEIIAAPSVQHLELNIPIYDETRPNNSEMIPQESATRRPECCELNIPIYDETQSVKPISPGISKDDAVVDVTIKISKKPVSSLNKLNKPGSLNKLVVKPFPYTGTVFDQMDKNQTIIDCSHQGIKEKNEVFKVTSGCGQKDKILILNSKQISKVPVGCPIFLGTNKILLTDVMLPGSTQEQIKPVLNLPQNAAPPLPLPHGVQLVLFANSKLTYTMTPGVKLSPEDKARMPALLETIKQQMCLAGASFTPEGNKSSNIFISDEVVDISDDETSSAPEIGNVVNISQNNADNTSTDSNPEQNEVEISSTDMEEVPTNAVNANDPNAQIWDNDVLDKSTTKCSQENLHTPNKIVDHQNKLIGTSSPNPTLNAQTVIEHSIQPASSGHVNMGNEDEKLTDTINLEENNENTSSSKKTILSDLMEMSGISAEDMAPIQVEPAEGEVVSTSNNNNPSTSGINNMTYSTSVPPTNAIQLTHELNTVSSFAELKYACQKNGQFYKLDVETGVVVPINVCVKKKPKTSTVDEVRIAPKTTIDLTEDVEFSTENEYTVKPVLTPLVLRNERSLLKEPLSSAQNLKKLTMFRDLRRPRILKQIDKKALPNNLQIIKTPLARSTEVLAYRSLLLQSKEKSVQPIHHKKKLVEESISLSDSSDEEPLIKKVKRKQLAAIEQSQENSDVAINLRKELEKSSNFVISLNTGPEGDPTALVEDDIKLFEDPPNEPLTMEDESLTYLSNEEGEEDCILGV